MKKFSIKITSPFLICMGALILLLGLTPRLLTAQKLSEKYLLRMEKIKAQELLIDTYITEKMTTPFPSKVMENYLNKLTDHGDHHHDPININDLPQLKSNFIKQYFRKQYFSEHPEAKNIYKANAVNNSSTTKLLSNGTGCLDFEQDPFDAFEGFSASGSVGGYTGGHCNAIPVNGVGAFGWAPTALNVNSDNFSLVTNGSDPIVSALDMTNNNSGFAARINSSNPCTPNHGINRLSSSFTAIMSCPQTVTFSYALVMEFANNHVGSQTLPFFVARILDNAGLELDRICVVPDMSLNSEPASNCNGSLTDALLWQDWQVETLTYNPVAGNTYTIEFIVADCGQNGHFGYAYLDDICFSSPPSVNLGPNQLICNGSSVTLNAGSGFSNYQWSQPGTCLFGGPVMTACVTGNYCVTVTDANGCTASDCAFITISNMPNISILSTDPDICLGESVTMTAIPSCVGCTYSWSPGGATTSSITVSPANNTTYNVLVTNPAGCTDFASQAVTVNPFCPPTSLCMHIDQIGNTDVGRRSVATSDGGFVAIGDISGAHSTSDRDLYVVKYNSDMTIGFRKRIGDATSGPTTYIYNESGFDVMPMIDGYLVAGTVTISASNTNIILLKLDLNGNFLWRTTKTSVANGKNDEARKIVRISPVTGAPDRYYLVGHTNGGTPLTDFDILIFEFDPADGSVVGTPQRFGDTGISEFATDAIVNEDRNAIIVSGFADITQANRDMFALKVTSNLALVSSFYNGGAGRDVLNSVTQVGKDLYFAGATRSWAHTASDNVYVMKVDESLFTHIDNSIYYTSLSEEATTIIKTSDNNLLMVGSHNREALNMKIDLSLNQLWQYKSSLTNVDYFNGVTEQNDGLFTAVGMYNEAALDDEFFISRFQPSGTSCCNVAMAFARVSNKAVNPKGGQRNGTLSNVKWGLIDNAGIEKYLCQDYSMLRIGSNDDVILAEENIITGKYKVMPNPSSGIFKIVFDASQQAVTFNIYDLSGRLVKSFNNISESSVNLDLSQLNDGIYILEANGEGFSERQKIVIRK